MYKIFGLEYSTLDEECLTKKAALQFDHAFLVFLAWSFVFGCAFALSKEVANRWHAADALEYATRVCGGDTQHSDFRVNQQKYREEAWKLKVSALITGFGFYVAFLNNEISASSLRSWNTRWPQNLTPLMKLYYRIALGYHSYRTVNQLFEARRKDFIALMIHHWFTLILLTTSRLLQISEVGILVMLTHDNGDLLLCACKNLTYWGTRYKPIRAVVFCLFVFMWFASRICAYSYFVLWQVVSGGATHSCHVAYWWLHIPLFGLLALHLYWTVPILRIAEAALTKPGHIGDVRSDKDEVQKKEI